MKFTAAGFALLLLLSACASQATRPAAPLPARTTGAPGAGAPAAGTPAAGVPASEAPAGAPKRPIISASHEDWRALIPAPFGSGLTQVQFPLKEVILFQGDAHGAAATPAAGAQAASDDQECYSKSGGAFAFRGAETEDYVLCFFHERLFRVEAALRLPQEASEETFGQWCDDWLSGLTEVSRDAERCEGRDKDTQFSATLAYESELSGPLITVLIYDIPAHDAYERRPERPALPTQP
jgi:hypothetical protein